MMIGFPIALIVANGFEWYAHNHLLHGTPRKGKARYSPTPLSMKSHWAHHKEVRIHQYRDDSYLEGYKHWRPRNEIRSLLLLTSVTTLALPIAPFFTLGTYYAAANYYYVHRRSHLDVEWGKKRIPWHYDHHMHTNQDANWCVTRPWFDYIMGTRVVFDKSVMESNPLGVHLPKPVEKIVNRLTKRWLPKAYSQLLENN